MPLEAMSVASVALRVRRRGVSAWAVALVAEAAAERGPSDGETPIEALRG